MSEQEWTDPRENETGWDPLAEGGEDDEGRSGLDDTSELGEPLEESEG